MSDKLRSGLECPQCCGLTSEVIDSRGRASGNVIVRRRICCRCQARFTSTERVGYPHEVTRRGELHPAVAILLTHLDQWANHVRTCAADDCRTCEADFNLVVRAHAVWANSQRRPAEAAPPIDNYTDLHRFAQTVAAEADQLPAWKKCDPEDQEGAKN